MKRIIFLLVLLALCGAPRASAQFTLVSGTVTDPNGLPWACGTISAQLVNNNGISATLNGVSFSASTAPVKLGCPTDPTTSRTAGFFQMQLADNTVIKCPTAANPAAACSTQTTWQFTANTTGIAPPQGTGPQSFSQSFTISGVSQTLSFSNVPALGVSVPSFTSSPSNDLRLGISLYDDFLGGSPGATNGSGTIAFSQAGTFGSVAPGLTGSAAITINAGTTVIVSITSGLGLNICGLSGVQDSGQGISDDGGNTYVLLSGPTPGTLGANNTCTEIWGTFPPSQAKAATTITITTPNISSSLAAATYTGVKSYGQVVPIAGANSAAATGSLTTQDSNNFLACGFGWFSAGADTYTATAGTARANVAGAAATFGAVLTDSTVAGPGALANSGTLSVGTRWSGTCVELRTVQPMIVTSGNIGALAWASSGVGNTNQVPSVPVSGGAGVLQLQTGSSSGNNANIYLPNNGANTFPVNDTAFDFIVRIQIPVGHTSTTSLFCGLQVNPIYAPGEASSDFVGFGYDTAQGDTGWNYVINRLFGTATRTSSGSVIDNQWHDLRVRSVTPGTVLFSVDGGTETTSSVALSYTPMSVSCNVTTRTAAARFLNVDFVQFKEYTIR